MKILMNLIKVKNKKCNDMIADILLTENPIVTELLLGVENETFLLFLLHNLILLQQNC